MAPIAPFYADKLYSDLTTATQSDNKSVHLSSFPQSDSRYIDTELEQRMQIAQQMTSMVLALRRKVNIKVRQPLMTLMVPTVDEEQRRHIEAMKDLILAEVNVKKLNFVDNTAGILVKRVKPDFKKLGPRYGKIMKQLAAAINGMSQSDILAFEQNGTFTFEIDGTPATIQTTEAEILSEDIPGWLVANEGRLTVALDITVTDELRREGYVRELINRIQNIRKSNGYEITDKIDVTISRNPETDTAIEQYGEYIAHQTLAQTLATGNVEPGDNVTELDFETFKINIKVTKA